MPATARQRALVLAICCASIVIVVMDITIVNVALPAIRDDLHASPTGLQWIIDAYTLVLSSFLVLAGSTADRIGRRRVFLQGLAVFVVGSAACALAPTVGWLIAARVLQAVGGTMLNPVAMAIIANTYPEPAERARAIGVFASMSGLALALGPILGGLLVDSLGWRAVFAVNVPIALVAIAAALRFVPESRAARARRFDPVGQALVTVLLAALVFAIIESAGWGWSSPRTLGLLALAALAAAGLVRYEPRRADPLLELRLFRSVPFASAVVAALAALCAFGAYLFVTTQYLQSVRGQSALTAGLCLVPIGVVTLVLSPVCGRMVARRGPRRPLLIAGTALTAGGLAAHLLTASTPLLGVVAVSLLFGLFLSMVNPPITNSAVSGMPTAMAGLAAAVASSGRQGGSTLGVAIAGALLGSSVARGGDAFTAASRSVWWLVVGLGLTLLVLAVLSTTGWARRSAERAASVAAEPIDRVEVGRA